MNFFTFMTVVGLMITNAITDAPNAIATLVGTKVISFKKATKLSAIFNFLGIILMSFVNISVANCISSMVNLNDENGIIVLLSAMMSVIIFALISLKFGIPTSETHGLIAGLTGATVAIYGWNAVNFQEWKNVIIGLIWSILGTMIIGTFLYESILSFIEKKSIITIKKWQKLACCGMSFMHGAQDGQKFIGVLILFFCIIKKMPMPTRINPFDNMGIIIYTAIIMAIGVSIGGKRIVDNIGSKMVEIKNKQALISDIVTVIVLFIASMVGVPVSTTHVKTMSIVCVSNRNKDKINKSRIMNICKAWFLNFPVSGCIGFLVALLITKI